MHKTHTPRKRFGQHFLTDRAVLQRIADAVGVDGAPLVEIGPGRGALTDFLIAAQTTTAPPVTVVELDRDLAGELERRYPPGQVKVIRADILNFDLRTVAAGKLRLVGNLPYNISTPLLFRLLEQVGCIESMLFMLQKEVALRLTAAAGDKNYGRLSVMTAVKLDAESLFDVPPSAFNPPPKVNSSVLRLTPKKTPLRARDDKTFNAVVAAAFGQRRKTLRNALAALATADHFAAAGINPALRAEALSLAQFIALADALADALAG